MEGVTGDRGQGTGIVSPLVKMASSFQDGKPFFSIYLTDAKNHGFSFSCHLSPVTRHVFCRPQHPFAGRDYFFNGYAADALWFVEFSAGVARARGTGHVFTDDFGNGFGPWTPMVDIGRSKYDD